MKDHAELLRTRGYSASVFMNVSARTGAALDEVNDEKQMAPKFSTLPPPGPTRLFEFVDEHEETINDSALAFPNPYGTVGAKYGLLWDNLPADRHGNACNAFYTDGHAATWRWKWKRTVKPAVNTVSVRAPENAADRADFLLIANAIPGPP